MYKIAKILLILKLCSSGGKASLLKLHLFNWAMLDAKRLQALNLSAERKELMLSIWGIDPSLNMALSYALSEGLINKTANGMFQLTDIAEKFITESKLTQILEDETKDLVTIGKKITEKMIDSAARRWANEV